MKAKDNGIAVETGLRVCIRASLGVGKPGAMLASGCSATGDRNDNVGGGRRRRHGHTLAILTYPHSASARIVNGAILETAMSVTSDKLSVVIRASAADDDGVAASLTQLRRYVGEVYSVAWDAAFGIREGKRRGKEGGDYDEDEDDDDNEPSFAKYGDDSENSKIATSEGWKLLDLIVYPENVPNVATEDEIALRPDLSCVCGRDSIALRGRGGGGGWSLREHVDAVNAERASGGISGTLEALHVDVWPDGADATCDPNVIFLEDDDAFEGISMEELTSSSSSFDRRRRRRENNIDACDGPIDAIHRIASPLYSSVCVGGTFDMMHYGHRKLLTLAVSSVRPDTGRLHVGVKSDDMLTRKAYARCIRPYDERVAGVLDFVSNLSPAMDGRVRCVPLSDEYGPPGLPVDTPSRASCPGLPNDYDALVISHESLPAGRRLNIHREEVLGLRPLKLLCTQRTEPHGMSSTALRRMRMERRM